MYATSSQYGVLDHARPVNWACRLTDRLRLWHHFGLQSVSGLNGGLLYDLTRRPEGAGRQIGSPAGRRGSSNPGVPGVLRLSAGGGYVQTPWPIVSGQTMDTIFRNLTACTVLATYRKRDTTARASALCGASASGGSFQGRIDVHLPYSDGTIYWDFGGATSGSSRLSIGGHTFDTEWHWWAFVVGDGQGMRVYKDGKLLGSNSGTPTRTAVGATWWTGANEFAGPDEADLNEVLAFDRGLSQGEVRAWMRQSQRGHPDTLNWQNPTPYLLFDQGAGGGGGPFDPAAGFPWPQQSPPNRPTAVPVAY